MYANLEIRIQKREEPRGYPVELSLNGNRLPRGGHLAPEILSWQPGLASLGEGEQLFNLLLAESKLKQAWAEIRGTNHCRRIRLSLDEAAVELHSIPWELLWDTSVGEIAQSLASSADTPFSRYLPGIWPDSQPIAERPIKLLAAIANPANLDTYQLDPLDLEQERQIIVEGFDDLIGGQVELTFLEPPITLSRLEAALKQGYHILHLVAHGMFRKMGVLFLANESNYVKRISDRKFAEMINRQGQKPQLIFLASCQSASSGTADAFRGVAPKLIEVGIPAVLAMQDFVPVPTAREFTRVFYRQLFQHGQVDLASNEARSALLTGEFSGRSIPVLFSRLPDNQLLAEPDPLALPIIERQWFEPETAYIPVGEFLMGSDEDEPSERPAHLVTLPAYRIGKYPVTNKQFAEFITKSGRLANSAMLWDGQQPPPDKSDYPVTGVTWDEALAYCQWLSKVTGRNYTLPSEAEWEKAARGADGRRYPWGNEWQENRCNRYSDPLTLVTTYPPQNEYGCCDMVGNSREWTCTVWGSDPAVPAYRYKWADQDGRNDLSAPAHRRRVYRGGAADNLADLRCSRRDSFLPDKPGPRHSRHGFRVVLHL